MHHPPSPRPTPRTVLVVGAGLSATALVAALRGEGFAGEVVVAGDEAPYDRPPLSKELFTVTDRADLRAQFALADDAATWLAARATAVTAGGGVTLVDAAGRTTTRTADAVVLALGARPVVPPGWDARTLSTWADAEELRAALEPGTRLAIAGAGWIGLELASSALAAGVRVTVVEETGRPLGRHVPTAVGDRIASWLGGVALVTGRVAAASPAALDLTDGRVVRADVVVAALGARPATGWLPPEWLEPDGHVRADASGRVSPGVWAIGDCAGDQHWNAAVASAVRCARALLGRDVPPVPPPSVFSSMFGHQVDLVGRTTSDLQVLWRDGDGGWTALLLDGEVLVGGVAADRPRDVAALRRALAGGSPRVDRGAAAEAGRRLADALSRR